MGREKQREHDTKGICSLVVFGTLRTSDARTGQVPRLHPIRYYERNLRSKRAKTHPLRKFHM
jgi:hypothetical protein